VVFGGIALAFFIASFGYASISATVPKVVSLIAVVVIVAQLVLDWRAGRISAGVGSASAPRFDLSHAELATVLVAAGVLTWATDVRWGAVAFGALALMRGRMRFVGAGISLALVYVWIYATEETLYPIWS
jgi:hypothetical protein